MLENIAAMSRNIIIALGGKMTIIDILFASCRVVYRLFGLIGQHASKIHNKFILCPKKKFQVLSPFLTFVFI